jgi:predicted DNA-binding transcriptional regulator YafY
MARNEQLIRQHKLLQILERYRFGRTLDELRAELVEELGLTSLHQRSVRRDLMALQAAGIDVVVHATKERGNVWKLGPRFRGTQPIRASATELLALSLARDLLTPLVGTPFWIGIESFWSKIRESLPCGVAEHYEKYRQVLHVLGVPAKSYAKQRGILKTINRSILEHRVVEISYQPLGQNQPATRRIEPYGIALYQGSLYVIADACEVAGGNERVRHWKLDRFRKASALDAWFRPRSDFHLERHLRESIGIFGGGATRNFRIRISAFAARWVEEDPWHPDQAIARQEDGSVILSVPAAHDLEVLPRVLALGAEAELLAPASSRRRLAETIRHLSERYRDV